MQAAVPCDHQPSTINHQPSSSSGFSLVEVSLALLVVVVGILSVLYLFPKGLEQNISAEEDTYAALFAEEMFNGMRAQADADFNNLANYNVLGAAYLAWDTPFTNRITGTSVVTQVYKYTNIIDHVFRYRLSYSNVNTSIISATLRVWRGEYGSLSNPAVFYTEFYRFKE